MSAASIESFTDVDWGNVLRFAEHELGRAGEVSGLDPQADEHGG